MGKVMYSKLIIREMEELQDKYVRFDWAIKRLLRQKANFDVLEGFLTVFLGEKVTILEILESESNQLSAEDKFNRVDIKARNSKDEIIIIEIQNTRELYYLERILYAANRRFEEMSAGQFELRMFDEKKAAIGKNKGLDLMVYSNVTGKEREVRTLSGGESFMAAVSMALGMADEIQENSAAIHLDMMFIDEGFGSLDEHAREQAVRVLKEMAGGSKLIGIISHVTELKQEMEDQLLITKDEEGSHVRWQLS